MAAPRGRKHAECLDEFDLGKSQSGGSDPIGRRHGFIFQKKSPTGNYLRIHGTGIFTYIWLIFMGNVGKYTIHGSYGIYLHQV